MKGAAVASIDELVRNYYLRVDEDPATVHELFCQDAAYHRPGYGALVGRERLRQFYGQERVIASGNHRLKEVLIADQSAAVRGDFEGKGHSGEDLRVSFADFFTFKDGLIQGRTTYFFMPKV